MVSLLNELEAYKNQRVEYELTYLTAKNQKVRRYNRGADAKCPNTSRNNEGLIQLLEISH